MKTIYVVKRGEGLELAEGSAPQPIPGEGEVLIRVQAAGVTPTELQWYPTTHTRSGETRREAIPCHEFCGTVAAMGPGMTGGFEIGQEVFGMNDWFAQGALAEFCLALPISLAAKPKELTCEQAASAPIGALTAWQGLFDRAELQAGERLLVHGGAGAVGLFAVQLAKMRGAHVIATASARNLDFVKSLGADEVIDYRNSRFEESVGLVDVVFDTAGGETLERSWRILKPNGRMVTIVSSAEGTTEQRVKDAFFIVEPNGQELGAIGELLGAGRLHTVVDSVFALDQAPDVYKERVVRRGRGKMVIRVGDAQ